MRFYSPTNPALYIRGGAVTVNIGLVAKSPQGKATLAKIAKIREHIHKQMRIDKNII